MNQINTHNMVIDFGRHKGELVTRVPKSYLVWMANELDGEKRAIAEAELERRGTRVEYHIDLSGHAIDRASLQCRKIWHEDKKEGEGLYTWLNRVASEALETDPKAEKVKHKGMVFVFERGNHFPTLKTVMRKQ